MPVFTKMFKHRDFSPVLSPTQLQHPGQKVSAARPHSPIKSLSPQKGGPDLREPPCICTALPFWAARVPFGVSSKQTSGVGDSESAGWHHTPLGKPHPFRGKFTQLTANMGYLYPATSRASPHLPAPSGYSGNGEVLLGLAGHEMGTPDTARPGPYYSESARKTGERRPQRPWEPQRPWGRCRVHKGESYHPAQDSIPTLLTP